MAVPSEVVLGRTMPLHLHGILTRMTENGFLRELAELVSQNILAIVECLSLEHDARPYYVV